MSALLIAFDQPNKSVFLSLFFILGVNFFSRLQFLDISVKDESHAKKIIDVMENAVTLEVPNKVDYEHGDNWGEIHG